MTAIAELAARFQTAVDALLDASQSIWAAHDQTTEIRDLAVQMGVRDLAERLDLILDGIAKLRAHITTGIDLGTVLVGRTWALAGPAPLAVAPPPTTAPQVRVSPPALGMSAGYPYERAHSLPWSDLHHICHGDPDDEGRGGHLHGTGRPGKTEFPPNWDDEKVADALTQVAANPREVDLRVNGNWYATGIHDGVVVTAVVRPDGGIAAGWPDSGPGVRRNPDK